MLMPVVAPRYPAHGRLQAPRGPRPELRASSPSCPAPHSRKGADPWGCSTGALLRESGHEQCPHADRLVLLRRPGSGQVPGLALMCWIIPNRLHVRGHGVQGHGGCRSPGRYHRGECNDLPARLPCGCCCGTGSANSACSTLQVVVYQRLRFWAARPPGAWSGICSLEVMTASGKVPRSARQARASLQLRLRWAISDTSARRWREDSMKARPAAAASGG